jgi:hypothetical protein
VSIGTLFGHENKYGNKHPEIEVLGEEVVWQEDTDLSLYPNGNVEWGYLAYEQQIQGVYMAASVWDGDMGLLALRDVWVSFYPGGQLKSGFVGEKSASLLGLNPGDEISFATNGKVKSSD